LTLVLIVAGLAACGSDTGPETRPARVEIQPPHPSVGVDQSLQMSATAFDDADQPLPDHVARWAVDDVARATVSTSGLVTGVSTGSTTISATIDGVIGSTDLTVTEPTPSLSFVTLEPSELRVAPGRAGRLLAVLHDFDGNPFSGPPVSWSSDDPAVASVDGDGIVSANTRGTTTVTASAQGLTASATVTVDPLFAVVSLEATPATVSVAVADTVRLEAIAKDAQGDALAGRVVSWSVVTPGVATVSADGLITGVSQGETVVRATADGFTADAPVRVLPPLIGSQQTAVVPSE
jgi:uncharacterized protein YjdB